MGWDPRTWLRLATARLVAAACLATTALVWSSPSLGHGYVPPVVDTVAVAAMAAWFLLLLVGVARRSTDVRLLRALPVLVTAAQTALLLAPTTGAPAAGQVWTMHPGVVAGCLVVLVCPPWAATAYLLVFWTELTLLHLRGEDLLHSLAQTLVIAPGPVIVLLLTRLVTARLAEVRDAGAASAAAAEEAQEAQLWAEQRDHWSRLIHDLVLGALLLGSRSTSPATLRGARQLAREALAETTEAVRGAGDRDWLADLEAHAATLGLTARVASVGPGAPPEVAAAMRLSARQALANVARHAGVASVEVWVVQAPEEVTVRILDQGVGFAVEEVGADRMGLHRSIPGHLRGIGGTARVVSTPGVGTSVLLEWTRPPATTHIPVRLHWPRIPVNRTVSAYSGVHLVLGLAFLREVAHPWWWAGGLALVLAAMTVLLVHRFTRWVRTSTVVVVAGVAVLAASVREVQGADGRLWMAGAVMPIACVLCMRGRARWGLAFGAAAAVAVVAPQALRGGLAPATAAAEAALQLVAFPLLCLGLAIALERSGQRIGRARDEAVRTRLLTSAARARVAEGERRMAQLDRLAIPLLRHLAAGRAVTADDRRAFRRAEAGTRDQLVADGLVDDAVGWGAYAARERGAEVELTVDPNDGPRDGGQRPDLVGMRAVTTLLLSCAGDGSRLTARWHPRSTAETGTVVLENAVRSPGPQVLARLLGGVEHEVDVEDGTVFVRILGVREPARSSERVSAPLSPFSTTRVLADMPAAGLPPLPH